MRYRIPAVLTAALLSAGPAPAQHDPAVGQYGYLPGEVPGEPLFGSRAAEACCEPGRPAVYWADAEYLFWYTQGQEAPPLAVAIPGQFAVAGGALPAGSPIFNLFPADDEIDFDGQDGVRGRVGFSGPVYGFDFGGFYLEPERKGGVFSSTGLPGSPGLARPYIRAANGSSQLLYSALPGQYGGRIATAAETQMWGLDANVRADWFRFIVDRSELLGGFRYLDFDESLVIADRSDLAGGIINTVTDSFQTENQFYGAQIGMHNRLMTCRGFTLESVNKIALGGVSQRVVIAGANTLTGLPDQATGLLAQPGNIGVHEDGDFAAVYESTMQVGYCFGEHLRVHVGYNFLWLSSAVRPGSAIDPVVNDSAIRFIANPPPDAVNRRPAFDFDAARDDVWTQGVVFGMSLVY